MYAPFVDAGAAEDVGAAYVFTKNGVVTQSQKLMASDGRDDRLEAMLSMTVGISLYSFHSGA